MTIDEYENLRDVLSESLEKRGLSDTEYSPIDADMIIMDLEAAGYSILPPRVN